MFLKEIKSMNTPLAIGAYSPAVKLGDFVYISGQLPVSIETNEIVEGGVKEQTHQVLKNIRALLEEMDLDFRHIVKTTIFIKNMEDFPIINEVYSQYFAYPYPARSTVEVSALPKNALVEIECFAIDTLEYEQGIDCECGCHNHDCGCEDHSCCCGGQKDE